MRRFAEGVSDIAHVLGQLLVFALLAPLVALRALLHPRELVTRLQEAPSRLRAATRRFELESRDPGSVPGKMVEATRVAAWFLREELADMRDGIPTAHGVRDDLRSGASDAWGRLARGLGLTDEPGEPPVGTRLQEAVGLGVLLSVVAVALFLVAFRGIEELKTSEHLALADITVLGTVRVSEEDVLARLGARLGDNMLELGQLPLGASLLELPWVASYEVVRDVSGRSLEVRVREHQAAMLLPGAPLSLVDDQGEVFKRWEAGEPFDLPLLTGVGPEDMEVVGKGALDVLHALRGGRTLGLDSISEIRWSAADGYTVVTQEGLPVRLGRRDFGARLARVERAVRAGRMPLDALASVDAGLRDRLVAVPRTHSKARRAVQKVVESQPMPTRERVRLLHLRRVERDLGEALFGADADL